MARTPGAPDPLGPQALEAPFFEGLAAGELRMQRCNGCGAWTWPARWRCGLCGSWSLAWEVTTPRGTIHSFARTHHATRPEFRSIAPYVSLLVSLEAAGGLRLLGLLVGSEEGLCVGAPVTGVFASHQGDPVLRWALSKEPAA